MLAGEPTGLFNSRAIDSGIRSARHIGRQLGMDETPLLIGTAHHDNHAWFSFAASPFARASGPTMLAVIDGLGDAGSISLYVCEDGRMTQAYCNDSVFDSLGLYYAVISSTQGGWTWLSSEGRYMGATAYGDNDRKQQPLLRAAQGYLRAAEGWPRRAQSRPRQLAAQHRARALYRGAHRHPRRADPGRQDVEPGRGAEHRGHQAPRGHQGAARQGRRLPDGVRGRHLPHRRRLHPLDRQRAA